VRQSKPGRRFPELDGSTPKALLVVDVGKASRLTLKFGHFGELSARHDRTTSLAYSDRTQINGAKGKKESEYEGEFEDEWTSTIPERKRFED
jgi:hypothetical protein